MNKSGKPLKVTPLGCGAAVVVLLFCSGMLTILLGVGIWPGEAKLTGLVLCPDDKPDVFVVSDTFSRAPGETSTNFTLYCVDENGAFDEIGYGLPMLLLWVFHTLLLLAIGVLLGLRRRFKLRRRAEHLGGTRDAEPAIQSPIS